MICDVKQVVIALGLALSVSTAAYALAPVEDASAQTQGIQTGELVPSSAKPTGLASETSANTAPVAQSAVDQRSVATTDNNPLVGAGSLGNSPSPALQNPAIGGGDNSALSSLPLSARVGRLEQQMQNLVRANTTQQVSSLQQQIQQLSGELQVQQHDIKLLNQQLRNFYQDLSTQIKQIKNLSTSDDSSSSAPAAPSTSNVNSSLPAATAPAATPKKKVKTSLNKNPALSNFLGEESKSYKSALNLLAGKKYSLATQGFNRYLNDYPNGRFVVSAHYWLGELYVLQRKLPVAIKQFSIVIKQFPHSSKVADARVKLAIIHASQGKVSLARGEFLKVKQQYAGTTAAQLASIQLQQLGHASKRS